MHLCTVPAKRETITRHYFSRKFVNWHKLPACKFCKVNVCNKLFLLNKVKFQPSRYKRYPRRSISGWQQILFVRVGMTWKLVQVHQTRWYSPVSVGFSPFWLISRCVRQCLLLRTSFVVARTQTGVWLHLTRLLAPETTRSCFGHHCWHLPPSSTHLWVAFCKSS